MGFISNIKGLTKMLNTLSIKKNNYVLFSGGGLPYTLGLGNSYSIILSGSSVPNSIILPSTGTWLLVANLYLYTENYTCESINLNRLFLKNTNGDIVSDFYSYTPIKVGTSMSEPIGTICLPSVIYTNTLINDQIDLYTGMESVYTGTVKTESSNLIAIKLY